MAAPHAISPAVCPTCGAVEQDHHADLQRRTYLTVRRLQEYLDFTEDKTRMFLRRNPAVRRVRVGNYLVIWRRDVDEVLAKMALQQEHLRRSA